MRNDEIDDPDLDDIAELAARGVTAELRTQFPAKIESYDRLTFTASVKPIIRHRRWDPEQRAIVDYLPKIITGCRVVQHYTDQGGLIVPYKRGDYVWCECSERSMAEWAQLGNEDFLPQKHHRHSAKDTVVTGPIRPRNAPPVADATHPDDPVLNGDPVRLGDATASEFVALRNLVEAEIDALWDAMESHVHGGVLVGAAATLPPSGTAIASTPLKGVGVGLSASGSVAATKVLAK